MNNFAKHSSTQSDQECRKFEMGLGLEGGLRAILYANRFVIVGNFNDVRTKDIVPPKVKL